MPTARIQEQSLVGCSYACEQINGFWNIVQLYLLHAKIKFLDDRHYIDSFLLDLEKYRYTINMLCSIMYIICTV